MNDRELADKVVALLPQFHDWGDRPGQASGRYGELDWHLPKIASDFVRDWRVAGALMEKCSSVHLYWDDVDFGCDAIDVPPETGKGHVDGYAKYGAPCAIIEACVEALS